MKYVRWIVFGLIAAVIVVLWILLGSNKKLRQQIEALLLERLVKNKIQDLRDRAVEIKAKADANQIDAEKAKQEASAIEQEISEHKDALQMDLESRGLDAKEIADRFRKLNL